LSVPRRLSPLSVVIVACLLLVARNNIQAIAQLD